MLSVELGGEEGTCICVIVRAEYAVGRKTGAGRSLGNEGWPPRLEDAGDSISSSPPRLEIRSWERGIFV